MSADIVERLRMPCSSNDARRQRDEAADEIERWRVEAIDMRKIATANAAEIERLRAENDMMRSLLIDAPTKEERDILFERRFKSEGGRQ